MAANETLSDVFRIVSKSTAANSWKAYRLNAVFLGHPQASRYHCVEHLQRENRHLQQQQQPFNCRLSGTTRVGRYQKEHSPTHTHPDHRASFNILLHLQRSMASSLFNLRA